MCVPVGSKFPNLAAKLAKDRKEIWPYGTFGNRARARYLALLLEVGKPSTARILMDKLELWDDDRRAPDNTIAQWTREYRAGGHTIPEKVLERVKQAYDAYRRARMDEAIDADIEAKKTIADQVVNGTFDAKYSGALQHLGQFVAIGTEKRQQVYAPRSKGDSMQVTPTIVFMAPKEITEGEVKGEFKVLKSGS